MQLLTTISCSPNGRYLLTTLSCFQTISKYLFGSLACYLEQLDIHMDTHFLFPEEDDMHIVLIIIIESFNVLQKRYPYLSIIFPVLLIRHGQRQDILVKL